MSIQIENNLKNNDEVEQQVHYVPCKIEEDGPANVKQYFEPFITENDEKELQATFRGHSLDGVKMETPEGYQMALVTEAKRPLAEHTDRRFQVAATFKNFTYWNWDKKPSINDNLVKAYDWIDIADAIHND